MNDKFNSKMEQEVFYYICNVLDLSYSFGFNHQNENILGDVLNIEVENFLYLILSIEKTFDIVFTEEYLVEPEKYNISSLINYVANNGS